jgi:integrase
MSKSKPTARRERVERNIYRRTNAAGRTVFEVGYRDSGGTQRWCTVEGGITAARAERDSVLGRKGKGGHVQPNPRLRFGEAADRWLADQVATLRPATQASYRNSVNTHLCPRWGRRRLDSITVDDAAKLVSELRSDGKAEWTISTVLRAGSRVFKFSHRRLGWHGENPIAALDKGERPKTTAAAKRRIFSGDELAQTLAAAAEPYRTLFALAATTGARLSECLGLVWADLDLADPETASVRFDYQVDRQGRRQPLKTQESRRTVELPRSLAALLTSLQAHSAHGGPGSFVFATRTGRALGQRNVLRELRGAMTRAVTQAAHPTFPALHEPSRARGTVPNFHAFRHTAASEAIAAGDGAEEVSWQLGHKSSNVTRAVYVQEIKDAERRARRRAKMEARYGSRLEAAARNGGQDAPSSNGGEVVDLHGKRHRAQ